MDNALPRTVALESAPSTSVFFTALPEVVVWSESVRFAPVPERMIKFPFGPTSVRVALPLIENAVEPALDHNIESPPEQYMPLELSFANVYDGFAAVPHGRLNNSCVDAARVLEAESLRRTIAESLVPVTAVDRVSCRGFCAINGAARARNIRTSLRIEDTMPLRTRLSALVDVFDTVGGIAVV